VAEQDGDADGARVPFASSVVELGAVQGRAVLTRRGGDELTTVLPFRIALQQR
jgi:hypothetical protein